MVFTDQELEQIGEQIGAMRVFATGLARRVKLVSAPTAKLSRARNNVAAIAQAMLLQLEHLEQNTFSLEVSPLLNYPTGEYSAGIRLVDKRAAREEASNEIGVDDVDAFSLGKLRGKLSCLTVEVETEDAVAAAGSVEPRAARTRPLSREGTEREPEGGKSRL